MTFDCLEFNQMAIPSSQGGLNMLFILDNYVPKVQIEDTIIWEEFGDS